MGVFWWIPALIPLIGALILLVCPAWPISRWEGAKSVDEMKRNWTKFGVYLAVNILACLLFAWGSWEGAVAKMKFREVWNFKITGIKHEMKWTTHETYTTTHTVGSGKNARTVTKTHHYTKTHGPNWYYSDEYGRENVIDEGTYNQWKAVWKNESQTGMHKGSSAGFDRKIDGPIFECSWPGAFETIWPGADTHTYVNKIRTSHSVLKWGEATKQQKAKYPRPVDKGNLMPVVVYSGSGVSGDDVLYLQRINASLGRPKEIHAMLVLFGKDADRSVVTDILTAWQGPNKNELVTFVSLDGQTVRWVEVHSWMDNTTLHATLRDELMGQAFTVRRYGDLLRKYVPVQWQRKHFTPINTYLHVDIHPGWIILALILGVICGVISYFVIERVFEGRRVRTWGDDPEFWKYRAGLSMRFGRFK